MRPPPPFTTRIVISSRPSVWPVPNHLFFSRQPSRYPRPQGHSSKEIARLFVPKGSQDEAPTTLSNQESKCGEGPFMAVRDPLIPWHPTRYLRLQDLTRSPGS